MLAPARRRAALRPDEQVFLPFSRTDAAAADPATAGAPATPANRIVGLWSTVAQVGPCGGAPTRTVRNTLLFHAGGTLFENLPVAPASLTARGYGLGTWSYDPATK